MGHVGSKTKSLGQIFEKPFITFRGHIFCPIIMKLGQNVSLMKSGMSLKMGHVGSKTMSLGQILEKLCVCSRGHNFSTIIMKPGQSFFLISEKWVMWRQKLGHKVKCYKTLCTL